MNTISYSDLSKEALEQLQKGAFLTVKAGEELNTMTIAWGSIGYMWNRPVFTVMVRHSRHTWNLIEKARDFTVSLPLNGQLKQALGICGSKSGRDVNKFEACNLTAEYIEGMDSPVISECDLHFTCKIVFKQDMTPSAIHSEIRTTAYPNQDYHVLYYGEIIQTLTTT